jgi:DNA-binding MarR family transcriptional regulator
MVCSREVDESEYDPPERLRRLASWQLARAASRAAQIVGDALAQENARRQHYSVLSALAERGPASQAELGRRLWIDRSDLHALLAELEESEYIQRVRDEQDRRRNVVTLTDAGAAQLKRLDGVLHAAQDQLLKDLGPAERAELERLLQRVHATS